MLIVRGAVKDYDWGVIDGLARWSGESTGGPQAELWFGVHPGGPTPLVDHSGEPTGEHLADHFDIESIPILAKLLAAARPLSVQVHPTARRAAEVFHRQQSSDGPDMLTDPFEKTEMLVALEHFEAFAGWRDVGQAAGILDHVPDAGPAAALLRAGDVDGAIRSLLSIDPVRPAVGALPAAATAVGLAPEQCHAYAIVADLFPTDIGALVTVLLDYLELEVGEAVFVPAGVPHSYIRGTGLEVMSSSDNVLRLGLTTKAVLIDEALAAIEGSRRPQVLRTVVGDVIWPVASPFVVRLIESGRERVPAGAYRIVLLIDGSARVVSEIAEVTLRAGTAAVMAANDPDAHVEADGLVAIVQSTER